MNAPHYTDATVQLHHGDCLDVLRGMPDASVDAVVTDPPYGLEFMGKAWDGADGFRRSLNGNDAGRESVFGRTSRTSPDGAERRLVRLHSFQEWCEAWATECLRVLKPGGHLLAFGGTRTWHRLACAVEDAGFEVRDSIAWMYGSGFPKSLDVSKAIDKAAGAERVSLGVVKGAASSRTESLGVFAPEYDSTAPATPDAERWQGWGTALKPAFEPVVVARKPLTGTVASNVLAWGTGALNIDGCRIGDEERVNPPAANQPGGASLNMSVVGMPADAAPTHAAGRWPANVVLDESQAAELDQQSGDMPSSARVARDDYDRGEIGASPARKVGDVMGFFYVAKAAASERPFIFRPTCECEDAWPTPSAARATAATTSPESLSTSKHGKATTADPSQTATRSTTSTATSSTTTTTTSSQSLPPTTSASTPGASSETASGGSPAASAASSSASAPMTGTSAAKGGRSTAAAVRAISRGWSATSVCGNCGAPSLREAHATVKPLALMRWLVRLVTPPGGTVLEPFAGSGTTVEACILEGFHCVAIEREADYLPLIVQRINRRRDPVAAVIAQGDDAGLFDLLDGEPA